MSESFKDLFFFIPAKRIIFGKLTPLKKRESVTT